MIYSIAFASFCFGFALAVLLITRSFIRPEIKQVLKNVGVIKDHKARNPKKPLELANHGEREI